MHNDDKSWLLHIKRPIFDVLNDQHISQNSDINKQTNRYVIVKLLFNATSPLKIEYIHLNRPCDMFSMFSSFM